MTTTAVPPFNADDDDLDAAIPVGVKPNATTNPTSIFKSASPEAVAKHLATQTATPVSPDDEFSFDDENINDAVKGGDGLTMVKINKGEVARFSFVPNSKILRSRVHYVEGTGSIQCISTEENPNQVCCRKGGQAKDRFVGLIYRYTNVDNKTGKFVAGATAPVVEVQAVRMSRSNMRDILDSVEDGQSVYDVDIRMKHDESRAFGYKFSKAASKPSWKAIEAEALALSAPYDKSKLASRLGKKFDATQMNVVFAAGAGNTAESQASMEKMLAAMDDE
jgi:hypothetical protein